MEAALPEAHAEEPAAARKDVYSRLHDPRSYTGVYRKRFETDAQDLSEHNVHDLGNMMRTNLNYDVDPRTKRAHSPRMSITVAASSPPADDAPAASPARRSASVAQPSPERIRGDPNDPHTLLKAVFQYYCRFGRTGARGVGEKTLDNANFSKLCRECPDLLDAGFTKTDVDLIFVKAKKKGERRINYARFLDALGMIAVQKYGDMPLEASVPRVLESHIAQLPCIVEFTDGKVVQAVWQKRAERDDSGSELPSPPSQHQQEQSPPQSPDGSRSAASRLFPGPGAVNTASVVSPPPAPTNVSPRAAP